MRYPPYERNEFQDIFESSVQDTVESIKKDLPYIIREAVSEYIDDYYDIPPQWREEVLDISTDFDEQVLDELIKQIKIKK